MCELVFSLQEFLKIVPGLVIFPLSFYLAWKKLGTNVAVSITFGATRTTTIQISSINLTNLKDRPIAIYEIHAVINKSITYEVDKFEPPLILKPLESLVVKTKPYSSLGLGSDTYEPDFSRSNKVDIYLVLAESMVKCQIVNHSSFLPLKKLGNYQKAWKKTVSFNDEVYNERAVYAITYRQGSEEKTAFIDSSGFIGRNWDFKINMIPSESMNTAEQVRKLLEEVGFAYYVESFFVDDLRKTS